MYHLGILVVLLLKLTLVFLYFVLYTIDSVFASMESLCIMGGDK